MLIKYAFMDEAENDTGENGGSGQETGSGAESEVAKELARMKKALAKMQKERDDSAKALNDFKTERDREKMSSEDRVKAEIEEARRELVKEQEARKALELARQRDQLIMELVSRHNLRDAKFGAIVLSEREEGEDVESLVKRLKKDSEMSVMFRDVRTRAEDEDVEAPGLHGSAGTSSNRMSKAQAAEQEDLEMARRLFPYNEAKQKAFIERKKLTREKK